MTHYHPDPRASCAPIDPLPVSDLPLAQVRPYSLDDKSRKDVEKGDDPFGRARGHEVQSSREDNHVEHIVEQSKAEERTPETLSCVFERRGRRVVGQVGIVFGQEVVDPILGVFLCLGHSPTGRQFLKGDGLRFRSRHQVETEVVQACDLGEDGLMKEQGST
jgi:hypothetical protein